MRGRATGMISHAAGVVTRRSSRISGPIRCGAMPQVPTARVPQPALLHLRV